LEQQVSIESNSQIRSGDRHHDYCLVFMHIPKTAGTTLYPSLQWSYPPHQTLHIDIPKNELHRLEQFPLEYRSNLRLLHGHFAFGVHKYVPRTCRYVTVLREPVTRVISAYKHVLKRTGHPYHERVIRGRIDLEEFIQTFWLEEKRNRQIRNLCNEYDAPVNQDLLEQAKRNLEGFLVVGLTERFEETFALIRRTVGLRLPFYVTRNVGFPLQASERAIQLIREREELDMELYTFAQHLFDERVEAQGSSFGLEVLAYRAMQPVSRAAGSRKAEDVLRRLSAARAAWDRARVRPFKDERPDPSFSWGGRSLPLPTVSSLERRSAG
jgi:Sulfotransferase family